LHLKLEKRTGARERERRKGEKKEGKKRREKRRRETHFLSPL